MYPPYNWNGDMAIPAKRTTKTAQPKRKTALEEFKEKVINTTWQWDDGCIEGKIDFLDALGLTPPKKYVHLVVSIDVSKNANLADELIDYPEGVLDDVLRRAYLFTNDSYEISQLDKFNKDKFK